MIDKIGTTYNNLYNEILIKKKYNKNKNKIGGNDTSNSKSYINGFINKLSDIIENRYNTNRDKYLNYQDLVTSKYYTDEMVSCLRRNLRDKKNIESLKKAVCDTNIYKYLTNIYTIPKNIKTIESYISYIYILIGTIFIINMCIVAHYFINNYLIINEYSSYYFGIIIVIIIFILLLLYLLA